VNELLLFQKVILALAIGALVGIEREKRARREIFAGIRTFPLVCLLGLLTSYLSSLIQSFVPLYLGLFAVLLLATSSYWFEYKKFKQIGLTTKIAFILIFLIGAVLFFESFPYFISVSLGILLALLLVSKETLHTFTRHLTLKEIKDAIIFSVLAFIILPLLPNYPIDPLGIFNPHAIWLAIILVLAISFAAYAAMKIFGLKYGLLFSSFFAGLVSSTSLTANMAERVKKNEKTINSAVFSTTLASSTMFLRQLLVATLFNPQIFQFIFLPLFTIGIAGILISKLFWKKVESYAAITISSPLSIRPALKFSIFLIFVLAFVRLTGFFYGSAGIPLVSFLAGLPEVDAITISLATSAEKDLPLVYAAIGILLAGIANTIFKWILTFCLGNKEFFIASGKVFIPLIAISLISIFIFSKISL
jgi:uncharacterized membrane protein (DUF4010 family)